MRNIWQWTVITIGKKVESLAIDKPHSLIGKAFQYEHNSERDQRIDRDLKEMGASDFEVKCVDYGAYEKAFDPSSLTFDVDINDPPGTPEQLKEFLAFYNVEDFEPFSTVDLINLKNTDRQRLIYFAYYYYKVSLKETIRDYSKYLFQKVFVKKPKSDIIEEHSPVN